MPFAYHKSNMHERYDAGRALDAEAISELMESIRRNISERVELIVDVGSGTGRFSSALAEAFEARVVGVEPAVNMRAAARAKPHPETVSFVEGSADAIPLEAESADLVFLSQVFHHLKNKQQALREVQRVLKPGGRLCVRQTTRENLDSYFYQRFFPKARRADEERLPTRAALGSLGRVCGFALVALETLRTTLATTAADYVQRIALRTYSDLRYVPHREFQSGLNALRNYCADHPDFPKDGQNDLFVFAKYESAS